jgi:hypothetical protein
MFNYELYKKIHFEKLCMQFIFFHKEIQKDNRFLDTWLQDINAVTAKSTEDSILIQDHKNIDFSFDFNTNEVIDLDFDDEFMSNSFQEIIMYDEYNLHCSYFKEYYGS